MPLDPFNRVYNGWDEYVEDIERIMVEGSHYNILDIKHAKGIAKVFNEDILKPVEN